MTQIVALIGPTAVGKTEVSIELAKRLEAEVVGCDSMQVYRRMNRLTTQPTDAQCAAVPHHLIDCVEPTEIFNVGQYRAQALAAIADGKRRGKSVLIVGGTGLYLKALTHGLCQAPPADERIREALTTALREQGNQHLYARLQRLDPRAAEKIHPNDSRRIVRALEVYELAGKPLSSFWNQHNGHPMTVIGLTRDRAELYGRINRRVERMIGDEGVLNEVRSLARLRLSQTARQVHGLAFLEAYLKGNCSLEQTVSLWQQQVRNYARRQIIWFRAEPRIRWLTLSPRDTTEAITEAILDVIEVRSMKYEV